MIDDIQGSEWVVFIAMIVHLILAPGTKVEESFNVQATHDILFHGTNLSSYDHVVFPGVVPRTFMGPLFLSLLVSPVRLAQMIFGFSKLWMVFAVRFALGATVVFSFLRFARSIQSYLGNETAMYLRILVATQFHFLFYSSRPLPNVFALAIVLYVFALWIEDRIESAARWAIVVTLLFRSELVLLFAPLFLPSLLNSRIPIFDLSKDSAIKIAVTTTVKVLVLSIPLDSFFWGRLVWPELDVIRFNVLQNRSHEYGTSPLLWYFYSALPRCLLGSLPLIPIALPFDSRLRSLVIPPLLFVSFYSILPHKELRFIIYVVPLLTLPASLLCARLWINRDKSSFRRLLAYSTWLLILSNIAACTVFLTASSRNYPGSDAIVWLQHSQRLDQFVPRSVHIDVFNAQNGVTRFHQLYPSWQYNKTEDLPLSAYHSFDFLLVGTTGDLRSLIQSNYTQHRPMVIGSAFSGFKWRKSSSFPYYFPEMKSKERVAVLKRKD